MSTNGIIYSPVSKMDISALNEKALHALKYHQLLKLSSKYNIKKRWAKKDDLVKCLLAVKESMQSEDNSIIEDMVWTDGKDAFKDMVPPAANTKNVCRSTFTVEKDQLNDSRATYNLQQTVNALSGLVDLDPRLTFDVPMKPAKTENTKNSKVKMLTVPVTRTAPSRVGGNKGRLSTRESPLKLSSRSITIKKSKDTMSPMKAARARMTEIKATTVRQSPKPVLAAVRKENEAPRPSLSRRKSKSDDPEVRRRSAVSTPTCTAFRTPPCSATSKHKPSNPSSELLTGVKPITVTKMPNFAAIHQRQFSKMDSLDEYINKKSERVKKLFGTPMASRPVQKEVLKPQNRKLEKVQEEMQTTQLSPSKHAKTKMSEARAIVNRKPPLRTQTDVKDKTRSHIHGIRTNRRFELQMKLRNI